MIAVLILCEFYGLYKRNFPVNEIIYKEKMILDWNRHEDSAGWKSEKGGNKVYNGIR